MLSTGQLIKASIKLYKENFVLFLRYLGFLAALWIVLIGTSALLIGLSTNFKETSSNTFSLEASIIMIAIVGIALGIATFAISLGLIRTMAKCYEGQSVPLEISKELHALKPFIWPAVYTSILAGILIILGFFVIIIPGILLSIWYAFATLEVAIDGKKGMNALMASRELSRNRWWSVFWRIAVPSIIFGILNMLIQFIILMPIGFFGLVGNAVVGEMLGNVLSVIGSLLVMPLTTGALVILYCELKKYPLSTAPVSSDTSGTSVSA